MAKVKKRAVVTGGRNVKASKVRPRNQKTRPAVEGVARRSASQSKPGPPATVRVVVKPLDPREKCGAGTSVQLLFRVDETVAGRSTRHLVFYDKRGWYCEHGRNCPAVGHAKKHKGRIARAT